MKMTVRQKSSGKHIRERLNTLMETIAQARELEIAVGYPRDASGLGTPEPAYDGEASIIEVAIRNNYGLGVPRRAFFEEAREGMQDMYREVMRGTARQMLAGEAEPCKVLDLAGLRAETAVRDSIADGNWQPNSPATIARKGSSKPLIDTSTMRNRVTHIVRKAER